ncbi:Cation channel sperm-associated protein 2 [Cricetulus griseus]|uniref:Cation channel sperm-associated protein 2 n=1 Tax=Cricetulus griseus TaxID=10029 RepID=G3H0U7_CRIGR|nr:Cation channel sperm-associated protein 2 [Cricetulus griseus]
MDSGGRPSCLGPTAPAPSRSSGPDPAQWPHQGAKNSTSMRPAEPVSETRLSKFSSSLLPEFVVLMGVSGNSVWLQLLRISRVLRSLKLFARFRQIKVIILALARALKSMTFLLMLLLIFFYIFAVTGVYFFEDYSRSTIENLEYNMFFSDLLNSLVTVFILFTLDHWYALLQDVWKVPEASRVFSSIYVILWLLLGSIIFRNIIVAMMGDKTYPLKQ